MKSSHSFLSLPIILASSLAVPALADEEPGPTAPADSFADGSAAAGPMLPSSQDESVYELDTYTVTATKMKRSLFDTQESIEVLPQATLEERGLVDLQEVLPQTANVYSLAGEGFGIRGIAHNSAATRGGEGESGSYYFDGVALTSFAKRFGPDDLWDAAQVEILRGPQSTNLGRNAIAGAVVIQTNDPVFEKESALRIRAGSYTSFTASGMTNVPLDDRSAVRVAVNSFRTDGFIENPTRGEDDYDARDERTFRGKYRWESEDGRLGLIATLQYAETERGEDFIVLRYRDDMGNFIDKDPEDRENLANLDAFERNESWLSAFELNYELDEAWDLFAITSFLTADYERFDDDDQLPRGGGAFRGREATDRNWAQEVRFSYDDGGWLRGVLGAFYTDVYLENDTDALINISPTQVGVPGSLAPFYPALLSIEAPSYLENETRNAALFTEWEADIGERWTVFAGARYDYEELDSYATGSRNLVTPLPNPAFFPEPAKTGITQVNTVIQSQIFDSESSSETSYSAFLPQVGVNYDWTENFSTGFIVEQGYRAGGVDTNASGVRTEYDPEYLTNFEFALRSRWFEGKLNVNLNAYYGIWEDQQIGVQEEVNNVVDVRTRNAGESRLYGFELEVEGNPVRRFSWFANLGFSHTEFIEFDSASGDFSGNRFGFAPEWTGSAGATWRFLEHWFVHGNVTYTGNSYTDPANEFELDARVVTNAKVGYRKGAFSASLFVNNVFDEVYLVNKTSNFDPSTTLGKVGDPRVIGVEIGLKF